MVFSFHRRTTVYANVLRSLGVSVMNGSGVDLSWNTVGQGQSGQAIRLFQITPYVNDFQTLNNLGS